MNLLLWAFISLQFSAPPVPKVGDMDVTPHPGILMVSPKLKTRPELWTCEYFPETGRCSYNHSMHVSHSIYWRQYPVFVET